jgi:hypothetical protein
MARTLTVISLLFQSTTHCRYRVYTKFLLTYTAIYRRNHKVLPLRINGAPTSVPLSLGHALYNSRYSNVSVSFCSHRVLVSDSTLSLHNILTLYKLMIPFHTHSCCPRLEQHATFQLSASPNITIQMSSCHR